MLQTFNLTNNYPSKRILTTSDSPSKRYQQMQILRYMGNKRGLLNWLMPILEEQISEGDTVLDLFAGTSSVGYALKEKNRIIANDIQEYSSIISRSLLEFNQKIEENDFVENLQAFYIQNYNLLLKIYGSAIKAEKLAIKSIDASKYLKFSKSIPRYGHQVKNDTYKLNYYCSDSFVQKRRRNTKEVPFMLFCTYYAETFFSLEQCLETDSLRYAIEQISNNKKRAVYLSCLMFAISKAVNSSGHFAEYLKQDSEKGLSFSIKYKNVSIIYHFLSKLSEFRQTQYQTAWKNEVYNYDWKEAIGKLSKKNKLKDVKLIYIDPPYTSAQYSRFYHVPETLVKYDYPELTLDKISGKPVKGAYRNDRVQSSFSKISVAEQTFSELFAIISEKTNATLAISYSDNSIIRPVDKIVEIASNYYEIVNKKNGHSHSAQGSRFSHNGRGNHIVNEYVLICKRKT